MQSAAVPAHFVRVENLTKSRFRPETTSATIRGSFVPTPTSEADAVEQAMHRSLCTRSVRPRVAVEKRGICSSDRTFKVEVAARELAVVEHAVGVVDMHIGRDSAYQSVHGMCRPVPGTAWHMPCTVHEGPSRRLAVSTQGETSRGNFDEWRGNAG